MSKIEFLKGLLLALEGNEGRKAYKRMIIKIEKEIVKCKG